MELLRRDTLRLPERLLTPIDDGLPRGFLAGAIAENVGGASPRLGRVNFLAFGR